MSRTNPDNFYGYLDLHDVCMLLQKPADVSNRKLVRTQIRAREIRDGVAILHQKAPNGICRTTLPLLRNHFPEWFSNRDHLAELLAEKVEVYEERFKRQLTLIGALGRRLRDLEEKVMELESRGLV